MGCGKLEMKKIKVLQCLGSLGIGGNEIFVMNFFRVIKKERFQVDFLVFDGTRLNFLKEIEDAGSRIFICPEKNKKNMLKQMMFVYYVLKKHHYDVVHCHKCGFKGLLRGTIPAKLAGTKRVISHSHSVGSPKHTFFDERMRSALKILLCWSIDYGLACSDVAGQSKYTKRFMSSDKYGIIHNAIPVEKYKFNKETRKDIRKKLQVEDAIVIGNVGRLATEKNQKYLLDIVFFLSQENKNVVLLIVGGGELECALKEEAERMGISNRVCFTGMVENANEYYSAMDVFVMPSLYEGLPFTAVEAQVNELKCVMADTVTAMTNISGDVEFLSLDAPIMVWAEKVVKQAGCRSDAKQTKKVLTEYDLKSEVKRLEAYYQVFVPEKQHNQEGHI